MPLARYGSNILTVGNSLAASEDCCCNSCVTTRDKFGPYSIDEHKVRISFTVSVTMGSFQFGNRNTGAVYASYDGFSQTATSFYDSIENIDKAVVTMSPPADVASGVEHLLGQNTLDIRPRLTTEPSSGGWRMFFEMIEIVPGVTFVEHFAGNFGSFPRFEEHNCFGIGIRYAEEFRGLVMVPDSDKSYVLIRGESYGSLNTSNGIYTASVPPGSHYFYGAYNSLAFAGVRGDDAVGVFPMSADSSALYDTGEQGTALTDMLAPVLFSTSVTINSMTHAATGESISLASFSSVDTVVAYSIPNPTNPDQAIILLQ